MRWLDLFSGIGGFALGLRWAGFPPPVAFCECEPFCQRVLHNHWPDVPIFNDVRELDADAVRPVELVTGGFPCQPWSVAGQRGGADDDRDLWPEMRRVLAAARSRWVLGENVPGIVGEPMGLDRVLADLEALGYASQAFCIPACAVDAPHIRNRIWIVASLAQSQFHRCGSREHTGELPGAVPSESELRSALPSTYSKPVRSSSMANAFGPGLEVGAGERRDDGSKREAAERGGGLGDAERTERRSEAEGYVADGSDAGWSETASRAAQPSGMGHWSNAEWLHCAFDGKARRVEPGVRLLAAGVPERVARLRALGNSVVPQIVERIGRAILKADAA